MTTLNFKSIDVNNIQLSNPDKLDNCYMCNLTYNSELLYAQTPSFSIHEITKEHLILNITDEFYKFIEDLEKNIIKETFNNCEEWFKREIPYDAIDNMYENIDLEGNQIKIKFTYIKDRLQCNIFNNKEIIPLSDLKVDDKIMLILHFKGLKIFKGDYHLDFYINQLKVLNTGYNVLKEYSFIDDENDNVNIDEVMFDEEMENILRQENIKKEKELELKNKMKDLENQLRELNN
tara:strand:+ start:853 stop:1554 length:702 start_codon:yes stop_codon:yes gene_type:complete